MTFLSPEALRSGIGCKFICGAWNACKLKCHTLIGLPFGLWVKHYHRLFYRNTGGTLSTQFHVAPIRFPSLRCPCMSLCAAACMYMCIRDLMHVCVHIYSILPVGWGLSVELVLLCLAQMPLPCNRACRGLSSLGGGTQRSPLAQLSVYTPQGSPWANTDVLPATLWSLGGRPAPIGSLQEGQTLKGPKRFAPVHDPQWAMSNKTTVVKLERIGIFCPGLRFSSLSHSVS